MNSSQPQRRSRGARPTGTRGRLLDAALEVVARDGMAGATSRAITEAAGANLAAITYHFGSKDELVTAAVTAEVERLVEPALGVLESDLAPAARLLDSVQLLLRSFATERQRVPLYFEAVAVELRTGHGGTAALHATIRTRLAAIIESLRDDGTIPEWVDPTAMAALILAAAQGMVLQSALDPDGPGLEAQAAQFASLLLAARTDAPPRAGGRPSPAGDRRRR